MSGLLVQFLIISIIPLTFVGLAVYTWRGHAPNRRLARWWMVSLLSTAVWASSLLATYLGQEINPSVGFNWRFIGNYALTLTGLLILITTQQYVARQEEQASRRLNYVYATAVGLWFGALLLDPAHRLYSLPPLSLGFFTLSHFDLWGIFWVASWLLPVGQAWLKVEQAMHNLPNSIYRTQLVYWFVTVSLLIGGGVLALLRGNVFGQQMGAVILLVGGWLGSVAVNRTHLPDLQATVRQFLLTLFRWLLLFGLGWGALFILTRFVVNVPAQDSILIFAAALFVAFILLAQAVFDWVVRRMGNTAVGTPQAEETTQQLESYSPFTPPSELADDLLHWLETQLPDTKASLFTAHDTAGGGLLLRPLNSENQYPSLLLSGANPLTQSLHQSQLPLVHQDVMALPMFADMPPAERDALREWAQFLYVPLHVPPERLVGLLTIAPRMGNEPYSDRDFVLLSRFAQRAGGLLWQAQSLFELRRINAHIWQENQYFVRENRRLRELVDLYNQFANLLSPELRRPFTELDVQLVQLRNQESKEGGEETTAVVLNGKLDGLRDQVDEAQAMIDNLIAVASHLEKQTNFSFKPVYIDTVLRAASKNLAEMAKARRVHVNLEIRGKLLPVYGDEARLVEAVQQLLHNAIKYNKLNHPVNVLCEMSGTAVRIQIADNGVGIPSKRLAELWSGLRKIDSHKSQGHRRRTRVGLPLAKFIIQSHGGQLEVRSTYGVGTVFSVYLPALLETV